MMFLLSIGGALIIAWIVCGWLDSYEAGLDDQPYDWASDLEEAAPAARREDS